METVKSISAAIVLLVLLQFVPNSVYFAASVSPDTYTENVSSVFTQAEIAGVEKLRGLLGRKLYQDYMKEDVYLVRWIRDSNFDVEKAKEKLQKALIWRRENRVDDVLREDFRSILQNCLFDVTGRDKKGRPILAASLGQCRLRKLSLRDQKKLLRSIIFLCEAMTAAGRETERPGPGGLPQQGIIIADMAGLSVREHTCLACLPFFTTLLEVYTQYYPEIVKDVYMINVSRIGVSLINLLMPLSPPNQREKVYAFGFGKNEWQAKILEQVDADQLAPQFGGTKLAKYFVQS